MGKVADSEQLKLKATWFNNVSVGLFLGGFIIPFLTYFQKVAAGSFGLGEIAVTAITMAMAWGLSGYSRWRALTIAENIKD